MCKLMHIIIVPPGAEVVDQCLHEPIKNYDRDCDLAAGHLNASNGFIWAQGMQVSQEKLSNMLNDSLEQNEFACGLFLDVPKAHHF